MAVCLRKMRAKRAAAEILSLFEKGCYYGGLESLLADYDALERENEELRRKVDMYEASMTDGEKARAFLASVPFEMFHSRDLRETNPELKAKIDEAFYTIQRDDAFWYGIKDLPHEIWRDVKKYEGLYAVSNLGRFKSFFSGVKILRAGLNRSGYFAVWTSIGGEKVGFLVHRLVAMAFIPNCGNLPEVDHLFGIKSDNRVSELDWVDDFENMRRAVRLGLCHPRKGFRSPNAKLSQDFVDYIRENPDVLSYSELAKKFAVSKSTIWKILAGRSYKDVK